MKEIMTLIKVWNNAGSPWLVELEHNNEKKTIPKEGLSLHINGGAVRIHGIDVTKKVQKGVENIFQYNSWKGRLEKVDLSTGNPTDSDNSHPPHHG